MSSVIAVTLIIIGLLVSIAGLIGCILPVLPGPPLSYIALIILCFAKGWDTFSPIFLMIMAVVTIAVTVLDFILPAAGAKKYGASKWGFWGSGMGMMIGVFFIPPFGMIIGALIGAVAGELISGKRNMEALKAGRGVFYGTIAAAVLKFIVSGIMLFYYVIKLL